MYENDMGIKIIKWWWINHIFDIIIFNDLQSLSLQRVHCLCCFASGLPERNVKTGWMGWVSSSNGNPLLRIGTGDASGWLSPNSDSLQSHPFTPDSQMGWLKHLLLLLPATGYSVCCSWCIAFIGYPFVFNHPPGLGSNGQWWKRSLEPMLFLVVIFNNGPSAHLFRNYWNLGT